MTAVFITVTRLVVISVSYIGVSPSGKAQEFDSCIPRFESEYPSYDVKVEEIWRFYGNHGRSRKRIDPITLAVQTNEAILWLRDCIILE